MCGRITLTAEDIAQIATELEAELGGSAEELAAYRARDNISPSETHWMAHAVGDLEEGPVAGSSMKRVSSAATSSSAPPRRSRRVLETASWGLRLPNSKQLLINARSETAERRAPFKAALASRRCVVPTTGFYEWTGPREERRPLWFHPPDGGLLLLAGLYDVDRSGQRRFTILTTAANGLLAPVHDRMPVLLSPSSVKEWLERPALDLLRPAPDDALVSEPAPLRINKPEGQPERPTRVATTPRPRAQLDLFGSD